MDEIKTLRKKRAPFSSLKILTRRLLFLLIIISFIATIPVNAWWWNSGISISPDGGTYYSTSGSKRLTVRITVEDSDGIRDVYVYKDGTYFSYISGKKCEWRNVWKCEEKIVKKCGWERYCREEYVCNPQCWYERVCDEICDGWLHICWETCRYEKKCGYKCGWKWVCDRTYVCDYEPKQVCKYKWENSCYYRTRVSKTISLWLHEGENELKVVAYNKYGDESTKTATYELIVPKLRINYFNVSSSVYLSDRNSWNVKVSYKVSDSGCGVEYVKIYVDGREKYSKSGKPPWCPWCSYDKEVSDNPTISGSGAGWHNIKLVVKSACDGTKSTTILLYVKKPKPSITYLSVKPKSVKGNEKYEANFYIHVKSKDPVGLDHYEIYDNGKLVKSENIKLWEIFGWYYPLTDDKVIKITLKGVETHTLRIYVYNKIGEYAAKTIRVKILDDSPPSITISPPSGSSFLVDYLVKISNYEYYLAKRLSIKVIVKEDLKWKSYTIWLDGKKIGGDFWKWYYDFWVNPHEIVWSKTVILLPGTHTLKVEVYDIHDHRSVKIVRYNVICRDSSAPKVTVSPTGTVYTTTNGKNVKFTVKVEDNIGIAHVIVKLNGITIVNRSGKLGHVFETSFTRNLPIGTYTIYVWARNYAGLITEKTLTVNVAHTEPPSITLQVRNPYYTIADETAKVPVTIKVTDDKGVAKVQIYVDGKLRREFDNGICDGALHICIGYAKSFDKTLKLALSIGKHTIKIIATDNTGAKSSKVAIVNIVHKEPEVKLCYDPDIPYFVKEIPVKVYVNSPEKGSVIVKVNSKLEKSEKVEAFKPSEYSISIIDLPNKYNAKKTYKITITLKTYSATKTYTRYVTLKRTAEFRRGCKFEFYVKVDKGYGHTRVWIEYDGKKITPARPKPELSRWKRTIVNVPFKIAAKKSGFVKVVAENEAGRDEKTLYLQVGNVQTPTVTPTPTPTPTPIPTPTPTPTVPASYEACYVQVNGGGANKDDSGGIGYAEAWIAGNEIHVLARQEGGGLRPSMAEGYVYSDFEYDVPTHNAKVTVKYYVSGSMFVIGVGGVGETSYYVKVELIDLTTGKTLGVKEHGDSYSLNVINLKQKVIDETITDTFNVKLIKGHKYRVKIYAKVTAKALGFGGTMSNFAEWDFSGKTRLIKFESICLKWT